MQLQGNCYKGHRTAAHIAIRKRVGINNLMHADARGDIITVFTKKMDKQQGEWTTTGDIRVRFAISKAAKSAYEQQRNQHNNRDTQENACWHTHGMSAQYSYPKATLARRRKMPLYIDYTSHVRYSKSSTRGTSNNYLRTT